MNAGALEAGEPAGAGVTGIYATLFLLGHGCNVVVIEANTANGCVLFG